MDYKNTLNLPKTAFGMKADLSVREPKMLAHWQAHGLWEALCQKAKTKPKYILHDGPPYANGDIHIGHALNKTLKDFVVKYKTMRGFASPYVPGWDCHGLPVEHQLFKELKISKYEIDKVSFRKKARAYALKFVDIQREQFQRLGVFGDWQNPYLTLDTRYEAEIIRAFAKLAKEGYIYKGLKPINWCIHCETALAEAEVEYVDHHSPSIFVKFKLLKEGNLPKALASLKKEIYFLIWTTTPWTLVANVAVALHPDFSYSLVEANGEVYLLLNDLQEAIFAKLEPKPKVIALLKGKELEGLFCQHPFLERKSKVVLADYVSNQEGTGCVHTAPGHGLEDYLTGQKYGLETIMPVDNKGRFTKEAGEFSGENVFVANENIIARLKAAERLFGEKTSYLHAYPHCWRCKKPVISRATTQWFIKVDHAQLRKRALEAIQHVAWTPAAGEKRISAMVESRPDWCISRQRYWGVPIPALYCQSCQEVILDPALMEDLAETIEKEGADAWFVHSLEELSKAKKIKCPRCGKDKLAKEEDILDVWFESGVSYQAVLKTRPELKFPAELYLEGSDQHRGWFQAALLTAMGTDKQSPFKAVLTHGFVVDGEGRKMSKSLGNVISPQEVIAQYGADVLRLWVAFSGYEDDLRISPEILSRTADAYRKIRNTCRFLLSNLYDFDPQKHSLAFSELDEVDQWALSQLAKLSAEVTQAYEEFSFLKASQAIYSFCTVELSSFYLDILKDRLYTAKFDSPLRRSSQTVLYQAVVNLAKLLAPILPFTAEEIWQNLPKQEVSSVHLSEWPQLAQDLQNQQLQEKWQRLLEIRAVVLKAIELQRERGVIGNSLEAEITLSLKEKSLYNFLDSCLPILKMIFIVSEVALKEAKELPPDDFISEAFAGLSVAVKKSSAQKCQRCWNYSSSVGESKDYPDLCNRCRAALKGGKHA